MKIVRNYVDTDLGPILSSVRVPTLVVHGEADGLHERLARRVADGIRGARLVELPSSAINFPWIDVGDHLASIIEEFLTGAPAEALPDRVLATVLFTDVVRSTEQAAMVGDRTWRGFLDRHDSIINRQLERSVLESECAVVGEGPLVGPVRKRRTSATCRARL